MCVPKEKALSNSCRLDTHESITFPLKDDFMVARRAASRKWGSGPCPVGYCMSLGPAPADTTA